MSESIVAGDRGLSPPPATPTVGEGRTNLGSLPGRLWQHRPALVVTLLATLYSWLITFPLILHLDTAIYGYPGDSTGAIAIYSWWSYALLHHQSIFVNTAWGAPYGAGWEAVPFTVLPVVVLAPLSAVAGGTIAYNFQTLSSFPLTAWVTFLVARRLGARPVGAAFAALAFTFIPYHMEKAQGHIAQIHMEIYSGILFFLLRWRQGGSRWNLAGAGAVTGLALWNDYYMAYIAAFLVAAFFAASVVDRRLRLDPLRWIGRHLAAGLLVAFVTALFLPATVLTAQRPSNGTISGAVEAQSAGFHQGLDQLLIYSAHKVDYFLPDHLNPLLPKSIVQYEVDRLHFSNFVEKTLFLGYTVMVLAALAVVAGWRRFETWLLLAIGAVGFLVAEPPLMHSFGLLQVPSPSLLLHPIFPIFRVYARFGVLVMLGATLLAGVGLSWLAARLRGRAALLLAVPFLLTAVEFNNIPPLHVVTIYPAPAEYQWLEKQPPGILVEYPLKAGSDGSVQEVETRQYTLYQHVHGHPIFNGGTTASRADQLSSQLEPYYGPGVSSQLRQIGIRYVFVHRADYLRDKLLVPRDVSGLNFVVTLNGVDVYTVG
jgi:hypothetical protein